MYGWIFQVVLSFRFSYQSFLFLFSQVHVTCCPILIELIIPRLFGKKYKLLSFSLCNFCQTAITSPSIGFWSYAVKMKLSHSYLFFKHIPPPRQFWHNAYSIHLYTVKRLIFWSNLLSFFTNGLLILKTWMVSIAKVWSTINPDLLPPVYASVSICLGVSVLDR